ncbi:hypothetical protein TYRP_012522 [Tyrophagus putrescentiae]|nr:hypothetical protein TYRP_012522 [Tyrophagus putrescentiae]
MGRYSSLPVFDASYEVQSAIQRRRPSPTSCPALRPRTSVRHRAPRRGASVHSVDLVFRLAGPWAARIETQRPESISPLPPEALNYHGPETIFSENFPKYTAQSEYTNQLSVKFYLELVPNGEDEECKDFVSVFLYMPCCAKPNVILKYKFWIINTLREKCNFEVPRSKSIGKLEFGGLSFDGSIFDAIDGKPIVIEDGKVDEMKSLWEYRKGKY